MENFNSIRQKRWPLLMAFGLASVFAVSLLLLVSPATQAGAPPQIDIGVAVDLSGPFGWPEANSVQLAVSQTNAAGGINIGGISYLLNAYIIDSPCNNGAAAISAANTFISSTNAVAVVGYTCSGEMVQAQPVYSAAHLALISPSASQIGLTAPYTTSFRTVSHDGATLILLATYFRNTLGLSRTAIIQGPFLTSLVDFYENTFTALGGTVVTRTTITDPANFTSTLAAIQTLNPDAIADLYYPSPAGPDPVKLGQLSQIAYSLGMTNVVMGWNTFDTDESVLTAYSNAAGPLAAENDYASVWLRRRQDMPGWSAYLAVYQAANFTHSSGDPGTFGPFAYDAARIAIAAIERANSTDRAAVRDEISATSNYLGVVGRYTSFDASGDVIPQWAWLTGYRHGGWVVLAPAHIFLPAVLKSP